MKPDLLSEYGTKTPETDTIQKLISAHPFVAGMSPHQVRLLSDCAMQTHFPAKQLIFREGDPANRFYLILKGSVALESQALGNTRTQIQVIGAGEVLGWSWLFPPYFWHFDARAIEPTDAIFLYSTPLREECEDDHELGYELMKRLAGVMMKRLQATRLKLLGLPPKYGNQYRPAL